jgi:hypothetical protein
VRSFRTLLDSLFAPLSAHEVWYRNCFLRSSENCVLAFRASQKSWIEALRVSLAMRISSVPLSPVMPHQRVHRYPVFFILLLAASCSRIAVSRFSIAFRSFGSDWTIRLNSASVNRGSFLGFGFFETDHLRPSSSRRLLASDSSGACH